MAEFLSGLQLSGRLYSEVVRPILDDAFPHVEYAAALIGWGSEVLGYDDAVSTDHNWGPRLQLFLAPAVLAQVGAAILERIDADMPVSFYGRSTRFPIQVPAHQRGLADSSRLSANHNVELHSVPGFFQIYLGHAPEAPRRAVEWLLLSEQRLLGVTQGRVFHDGTGELSRAREAFGYYPDDVWRYLLAVQWSKLAEEEAFVGRCGDVGDELGSRLIAARQMRLMIRLCFLMERRYAPYSKWLGTAFSRLHCAARLSPLFERITRAAAWQARERLLAAASELLAQMHNDLRLTPRLPEETRGYFERPYRVLFADRFATALFESVRDETLRAIPFHLGSVNQFVDSAARDEPSFARHAQCIYRDEPQP